jgi:hypothetical protein
MHVEAKLLFLRLFLVMRRKCCTVSTPSDQRPGEGLALSSKGWLSAPVGLPVNRKALLRMDDCYQT